MNKKVYPIYYPCFLTFEKMKSQKKEYSSYDISNMYGGSGKDAGAGWMKVESLQFVKDAMATQIVSMKKFKTII